MKLNFDVPTNICKAHTMECNKFNPERDPKRYQDGFHAVVDFSEEQIEYYERNGILGGRMPFEKSECIER